jgi:hypothetical protein
MLQRSVFLPTRFLRFGTTARLKARDSGDDIDARALSGALLKKQSPLSRQRRNALWVTLRRRTKKNALA